ncbi:MAG: ATP-dependent RecD-like DNA helicase [Tyzzerella sp.]|uniref:ATP-dependent RecD2 DNA helicase n=1 Tax=Candidatus Fimicola merdigallinarum TaxID=2840819 RepID=A0A9D9DXC8_9FIRM|nr:ATP-dependent RecD-like DNA helicase [Candidatus Fimicola merdigallinarum]
MEETVITGSVEDIIFQNKDNGYCVFTIDSKGEEVTCVGNIVNIHSGEDIKITGSWNVHPTYGKQFQVSFFERNIPTTADGIRKYLASGVIKGIGKKIAERIVDEFEENTFYVIEEKPEKLSEIKGISYEKAMAIHNIFCEQRELRQAMLFLQDFGVSQTFAKKIYEKFKGKTFDIVKENPYRLADEINGIGFKMADKMAQNVGIQYDSPNRIKSGVLYVLNTAVQNGHTYLPKQELLDSTAELLGINPIIIENCLKELQINNKIWQENIGGVDCVYLSVYYYSEIAVAKKLIELSMEYVPESYNNIDKIISKAEKSTGITLDTIQREAVKEAMTSGLLVITGGPGTGKTTTINTIIKILSDEGNDISLGAPTGRAAKRMTEATGMEAQTIHRLLGITFADEEGRRSVYDKNEDNPIDADVIIIDETSMVDINLMFGLVRAISRGTRLILVGDVDQLPSVGAGNVLKDIINSGKIKVVKLDKIFRQAQESAIVVNAHRINEGKNPILNQKEKDFFFVRRSNSDDVVTTIADLVTRRIPNFLDCNPVEDIQVLTPMKKSVIGVQNLNGVLQQVINPPSKDKKEKELRGIIFREGDKVMQIKNNYNVVWKVYNSLGKKVDEGTGIFNGDQGIIISVDNTKEIITVLFDDEKEIEYDFSQVDELELAYAITIHKSQGSEYPVVIMPIHSGPPMLMSRNLLYTGVTRAKRLVVIVGIEDTVYSMISNNREVNRYSSLSYRIQSLYEFMNTEF